MSFNTGEKELMEIISGEWKCCFQEKRLEKHNGGSL